MENTASKQSSLDQQATGAQCATSGRKSNAHSRPRVTRFASAGIATAYRDHTLSVAEIAKRFNVSQVTVTKHAKAAGVKMRHASTRKLSKAEINRIINLHGVGVSQAQISRMTGRSSNAIKKVLSDLRKAEAKAAQVATAEVTVQYPTLWDRIKAFFKG